MALQFDIFVTYSQIAVFWPALDEPFNEWTDEQVSDGYSWAPQSVSFKTPMESGVCAVEVVETRKVTAPAAGAIEVPFHVPDDEKIEVSSISDGRVVGVSAGEATLRYEVVGEDKIRLTFVRAPGDPGR